MLRNLVTNLMLHQRITTTLEKAKEIRPLVEKLIRRAKGKNYQGNVVLKQNLFHKDAIKNVKEEFVPRFENQPAGFTRVKYLGLRQNDRARMAYIEIIGNEIETYEKNEFQNEKDRLGIPTFWQWERKLLVQEQEYFQNLLSGLDQ
jgi:large subunit ribosomal protein L17